MTILHWLGEPYDLLIGRDILGDCRLTCNFTTGAWEINFKETK